MLLSISPIFVGVAFVLINSLVREPHRRRFNAVFVGGAAAAYLSGGGFGPWELAFTAVASYVAYRGLDSWRLIGIAWLLHTVWDIAHHLSGDPILPFFEHSSLSCAICDPVIALWCFAGGPSVTEWLRARFSRRPRTAPGTAEAADPSEADVPPGGAGTDASGPLRA